MKKYIIALLFAAFSATGVLVESAQSASLLHVTLTADGAITPPYGSFVGAVNSQTTVLKQEVTCLTPGAAGFCYYQIRNYAAGATGAVATNIGYYLSATAGTHTFDTPLWGGKYANIFPNGAYFDSITGSIKNVIWFAK